MTRRRPGFPSTRLKRKHLITTAIVFALLVGVIFVFATPTGDLRDDYSPRSGAFSAAL